MDEEYASQTNYGKPIVHGAFQVGLASTMAGMHLPGRNVVVGSMQARFPAPLYAPCLVQVRGEMVRWVPSSNSGMLRVTVLALGSSTLTAEIMVSFGLHEQPSARVISSPRTAPRDGNGRPLVIVTGARGALGAEIATALADSFRILALVRSAQAENHSGGHDVEYLACDLEQSGWEVSLDGAVAGESVYGIVHAAWPGAPKGGLLDTEPGVIFRQVQFGSSVTIGLANWLGRHAKGEGRLVALSSTAASVKPVVGLSAYSLGKSTLEHTIRLLAPELARKNITVNAVLPSFMPVGMNRTSTNRAILTESAKVPIGRLCSPQDVVAAVRYLLSREASFVTGQILPLTGGQL
jgi:NAD(P)-dependent dehydrogenase (short-subunit alcohol dehydrogenase family)